MSVERAFLRETILGLSTKSALKQRPGFVKVVQHVTGPLEDGSVVKEVSDGAVYIKAIFSKQSQDAFYESFEDSFSSQPEWQNAQLLLNQYNVQLQPSNHPANEERTPRFILVVERFGLLNIHTGFFNKSSPQDIMADTAVQTKAAEMEGLEHLLDPRQKMGGDSPETGSQGTANTLNALLEELGQSSLSTPLPTDQLEDQPDNEPSSQQDDNPDHESISGDPEEDAGKHQLLQKALEAMHKLKVEVFLVSSDQQDLLDAIPEWKDDYVAPTEGNLPRHLTCRSSSSDSNSPQDFMAQGSTLRTERDGDTPHVSADTSKMLTASEADKRATAIPVASKKASVSEANKKTATGSETNKKTTTVTDSDGKKTQTLEEEGKGDNARCPKPSTFKTDGGKETVVAQGIDAARQQKTGLLDSDLGHHSAPEQQEVSGDSLESSGDAFNFIHHPDVSFTISSPSMGNDSASSGSLLSLSNGSKARVGSKPDATGVTTVNSSCDLPLPTTETISAISQGSGGQASRLTSAGDGLTPYNTASGQGTIATDTDALGVSETRTKLVQQVTEPSMQEQSGGHAKLPGDESVMSATKDITDQHPRTERWRKKKSPDIPDFELPQTMEFTVQQSQGFEPPLDGNVWEQAQDGSEKHITDWLQSQGFEPCLHKERAWEQGETPDEMDIHTTGSQGFLPSDIELLDQAPDLSGHKAGSEHPNTQSASRMCLALHKGSDKQRQTSATLNKRSTGMGRVMVSEKEVKQGKRGREGEKTRRGERLEQSREMGGEREDAVQRDAETQRIMREKDGEDAREEEAEMQGIRKHTRNSRDVYQSTQSTLPGNSQPPSFCLSLSLIKHHQPVRRAHHSVLEMDEEENSRLLALEQDITEPASQAVKDLDVTDTPEALSEEGGDSDTATSLTTTALADSPSHEGLEAEDGGKLLVQASWSDSGEDSLDRLLLQQASRTDNVPSSHQTTVVPESSPEEVIVISSANDSNASGGTSESPSSGTSSDSNGDTSHGQPPLPETVIVISSSSGSNSDDTSDISGNSSQLKGDRECKLHPRPKNSASTSVNPEASRQPPLLKNSTAAAVDLGTKSPSRSGQKDSRHPACSVHSEEWETRSVSPAVSSGEEELILNPADQRHCHALDQPSGKEQESSVKRQQGKDVGYGSNESSPAKKQQMQRHGKEGRELRDSKEKQQTVQGKRKGGTDSRDTGQKHHEQGFSRGSTELRSPAKKQQAQGHSREGIEMRDSDENCPVHGQRREDTELRDSNGNCSQQRHSRTRRGKELRGSRDEEQEKGVNHMGREVRNSAEKCYVQGHSKGGARFRGSGQKQQMKGDRQTGRQSGTKETQSCRQELTNTAAEFQECDARKRTHKRASRPHTDTPSEKRFKQTTLVATNSQQHADNSSSKQTEGDIEMEEDAEEGEIGMEREKPRELEKETVKKQGSGADSGNEDFQEMPVNVKSQLGLIVRPKDSREKRLCRLKLKEELMNKLKMAREAAKVVKGTTKKVIC